MVRRPETREEQLLRAARDYQGRAMDLGRMAFRAEKRGDEQRAEWARRAMEAAARAWGALEAASQKTANIQ